MIEAVKGTQDWLPEQVARRTSLRDRLEEPLRLAGYRQIELPILEHRELYLRKHGEDILGKLYNFTFNGRQLTLRPELTSSVLRAYIQHMPTAPWPIRLRATGPVFRYEQAHLATSHEFSQVGSELLGATGPSADAETIGLALAGLQAAGCDSVRLTIGHIGLVREMLAALGLTERTQSMLVWGMEALRASGVENFRQQLANEQPAEELLDISALAHLSDEDLETLLLRVLPVFGVQLEGHGRSAGEVINRMVRKMRRADPQPNIDRALELLHQLANSRGAPRTTLQAARTLLRAAGPNLEAPLAELETTIDLLQAVGLEEQAITLDFGLGRGLHYYTGLIFEIADAQGNALCGGGRYDNLVTLLGGPPTPAVGFAAGIEQVLAAATPLPTPTPRHVLVAAPGPASPRRQAAALRLAGALRAAGIVALLDVAGQGLTEPVQQAPTDPRYAAIIEPTEPATSTDAPAALLWRDLQTGAEERLPIESIESGALVAFAARRCSTT